MSDGTTAGWEYSFAPGFSDDLVEVLTVALVTVWKDAQCFDELRRYDSLKWTVAYRGDPDAPEAGVGLAVMMLASDCEKWHANAGVSTTRDPRNRDSRQTPRVRRTVD